ncbi:hypothetical protein [Macrococcus carouselicus]|uniref:Uncharacterized protein n=1 Tax=Macrococcus carouselicus TaxID=69969 RepID=A0A9Q8CNK0_9STAP|nr:hypothetical protein [Macrococcus carouselicus]TDM03960.1 hypothetical protein ERX40_01990 [Macrococcus carouselicus]
MSRKWNHINSFIETSSTAKKVRHFSQSPEKKSKLKALVIRPVEEFDYRIESFRSYLKYTFTRPQIVADDITSGRYFLWALLNMLLYLVIVFFIGAADDRFNWQAGIQFAVSGLIFTLVLVVFTFLIQVISISSHITIYKVFVDILSYYTLVSVLTSIQLILKLLHPSYNHPFEIICFLVVMSIPTRLFISYHRDHKFEVDIFKMNLLLIILMVMYLMFTRNIEWLDYFRNI